MKRSPARFPLMAMGVLALLAGMWAGMLRLGWDWPKPRPEFGLVHGPLMVSGFVGTLIGLERAVALGSRWTYLGPVLTALGALALLAGAPHRVPPLLMSGASAVLVGVYGVLLYRQATSFTATMGLGAAAWMVGNGVWLGGGEIPSAVSWWTAFLVLTIAGERLELTRMLQLSRAREMAFIALAGVLLLGCAAGGIALDAGARVTGGGLIGLTVWLVRYDVARRTVRQTGLPRFTALCLLSGYVWLLIGGALAVAHGGTIAGPRYDAIVHAVLVGFVFSMIFGHAPIIFPAVLGFPMRFTSGFYTHFALLHLSVAVRIAGDTLDAVEVRQWGGLLNAAAVVLFLFNTVRAAVSGARKRAVARSGVAHTAG